MKKPQINHFPVNFRSTSAPDETNFSLFQFRLYELSILNRFRLTSGPFPVQFKVHLVCWKFQYMNMVKIENFVSRCTIIWSTWWCRKSFDWCRCLKLENFLWKTITLFPYVTKWALVMLFSYVTKWGRSLLYYSALILKG